MLKTLLLFFLCLPMFAGISRVQSTYVINGSGSNLSGSFVSQPNTGDTILIYITSRSQDTTDTCTIQSVTDGSNNQYVNEGSSTIQNQVIANRPQAATVFLANNVIGGSNVFTVNYSSAPTINECLVNVIAVEYAGVSTKKPVDNISNTSGVSNSSPDTITGNTVTSNNNDLLFVGAMTTEGGSIITPSGYTTIQPPTQGISSVDKTLPSSGTESTPFGIQSELYFPNTYLITGVALIPANTSDYGVAPFTSISKVQEKDAPYVAFITSSTNPNVSWSASVSPTSNITSGNTLFLLVYLNQTGQFGSINGIKDNLGNTFICLGTVVQNVTHAVQVYYAPVTKPGSDTITVYFTGSNNNTSGGSPTYKIGTTSLVVTEVAGIAPTLPEYFDSNSGYLTSSSTSLSAGNLLTLNSNDDLFSFNMDLSTDTYTPASGYTSITNLTDTDGSGNTFTYGINYKTVTTSGTYNTTATSTSASSLSVGYQIPFWSFGTAFHALGTSSSPGTRTFAAQHRTFF